MLPLAETEKLIREKDEEVSSNGRGGAGHPTPSSQLSGRDPFHIQLNFPQPLTPAAAPDAGDAGEDAGPDAAEPGRTVRRSLNPRLPPPHCFFYTLGTFSPSLSGPKQIAQRYPP